MIQARSSLDKIELYRIGPATDPFAFPGPQASGNGRFDDPEHQYQVLYAAEKPLACFLETLAPLRPNLAALAKMEQLPEGESASDLPIGGIVSDSWCSKRRIGHFRFYLDQSWLDLRASDTVMAVGRSMAGELQKFGIEDFDMSDVLNRKRQVTQAISRWAYKHSYRAIAYRSRFDTDLTCWAILEHARIERGNALPILPDDKDFLEAVRRFQLALHRTGVPWFQH